MTEANQTAESEKTAETPGEGHNNVSGARIKSFLERVERMEEEAKAIREDIKDIWAEAKATGFEPKILKKMLREKKQNLEKRREEKELYELYSTAAANAGYQIPLL